MYSTALLNLALLALTTSAQSDIPLSIPLTTFLSNTSAAPFQYPTDFTQGIVPKSFHSHNDYWRQIPLYSALSVGAISVEADVWLYNGTLHIGHEQSALTNTRTFDSLYISQLVSILSRQNPPSPFLTNGPTHNGVYDTSGGQTLYLFVDIKTDGATTFPYVVKALEPLRAGGWLTTFNGTAVTPGAITVIGTGNTPLNQVQGVAPRDYFYDAPIPTLNSTFANITSGVSPIASADFAAVFGTVRSGFNATQLALLRAQVAVAHQKGIMVRYWDQPGWPVGTRNVIWSTLWDEGVDLLNVDDLQGAANFWQGTT